MINFYSYYTGDGLARPEFKEPLTRSWNWNPSDRYKLDVILHIIKRDRELALRYADKVMKRRCQEVEPALIAEPCYAYCYAGSIIGGRWPEAEPYIMTDTWYALRYAVTIIKGRWPEAEPYIMKDISSSIIYARDAIKGRWKEFEPNIKDPCDVYRYAKEVARERCLDLEPRIKMNDRYWSLYCKEFGIE